MFNNFFLTFSDVPIQASLTCAEIVTTKSNLTVAHSIIGYFQNMTILEKWIQNNNKRPMGHIAHLRKQFKSLYHNVDLEKKKKHY